MSSIWVIEQTPDGTDFWTISMASAPFTDEQKAKMAVCDANSLPGVMQYRAVEYRRVEPEVGSE